MLKSTCYLFVLGVAQELANPGFCCFSWSRDQFISRIPFPKRDDFVSPSYFKGVLIQLILDMLHGHVHLV